MLLKVGLPTGVATIGFHLLNREHNELAAPSEHVIVASHPDALAIPDGPHTHTEIEEPMPPASHFAVAGSTTSSGDDLLSWQNNSMDVANQIASRRRAHHPAYYDMQPSNAALFYQAVRSTQST